MGPRCYITLGKNCIILGLNLIKRSAPFHTKVFEMRRCETGDFLELVRQMRHAAVIQIECNLRKRERVISKQFLYFFNPVFQEIILNGSTLN